MTGRSLHDLAALTDAAYRAEQVRLQRIRADEARLRGALAALEDQVRANSSLPVQGVREIGADILWQGWVQRMRGDIQMRLAMVLARKGTMIEAMRRMHGRKMAAQILLEQQLTSAAQNNLKKQIEQNQNLMIGHEVRCRTRGRDQMS